MTLLTEIIEQAEEMARVEESIANQVRPALLEEKTDPEFWSAPMSVDEFKHKYGLDDVGNG